MHPRRSLALSLGALAVCGAAFSLSGVEAASTTAAAPAATTDTPLLTFRGTTHSHTGAFNNHGSDDSGPAEIFAAAKAAGFDFWFLTEHTGPLGPDNPAEFFAEARQAGADASDESFIGVSGYEFTDMGRDDDNAQGHVTVFNTSEFLDAAAPGMNFPTLLDYAVSQRAVRRSLIGFNHPGPRGHDASLPENLTDARRDVAVMSELHNSATTKNDAGHFEGFVKELDRGWRVAPTCGLDTHSERSVGQDACVTGVLAPRLTRWQVVSALLARRTFSSRDTNLDVRYTANGEVMGSELIRTDKVKFDIEVSDPDTSNPADRIRQVDIYSDGGQVVASKTFSSHTVTWQPEVPTAGHSYFFVRINNGEGHPHTAIAAPVWLR